jgi:hypothetical protein
VTAPFKLEQLADLRPAAYNPRRITQAAADGLGLSLAEFGPIDGITWNSRTGVLVGGHQRVAKLKTLGAVFLAGPPPLFRLQRGAEFFDFPVRVVDWSVEKEKAANIAANNPKIAGEFTADLDALLGDVRGSLSPDLFVGLQFEAMALDFGSSLPDTAPVKPRPPVIRVGDVVHLGKHRLLVGPSTRRELEVAIGHWQTLTGQLARLDGSGETLDELRAKRAPAEEPAANDVEST